MFEKLTTDYRNTMLDMYGESARTLRSLTQEFNTLNPYSLTLDNDQSNDE